MVAAMNGVWRVVEVAIAMSVCRAALADGMTVVIDYKDEDVSPDLKTPEECRAAIRESDRETIRFFRVGQADPRNRPRRESAGWVEIVWGDGIDCLNDYSAGVAERITAPVRDLVSTLDDACAALGCQEVALVSLLRSLAE